MKKLLVTGGCGFIGSNFIRYILDERQFNGRIVNLDKLGYAGNPFNLSDIERDYPDQYRFVHGDICDAQLLDQLIREEQIDCICHFAAESHVDRSIADAEAFIQSNIIGTYQLLQKVREYQDQILLFHHVSTDEVFGSLGESGFFTESTPYQPRNPYSASKAASDHFVRAYRNTYELPVTITNCSNNYGPYQFPEKLIPLTILRLLNRETIPVYGQGKQVRDWLHVHDHCRAVWATMTAAPLGATFNVGGDGENSNLETVQILCDLFDQKQGTSDSRALIEFVDDRPGHDFRYAMDTSKIREQLGWEPQYDLQRGLEETIDWYLTHQDWISSVQSGEYQSWVQRHYS